MKETQNDIYTDKHGRRYQRISLEQRAELRKRYRANIPQWRQPIFGYLVAPILVALAILCTLYLQHVSGRFIFPGSLTTLVVLLVALFWGVGPALFSIVLSVLALDYYFVQPLWQFDFFDWQGIPQLLPFVVSGLTTAIITAQRERARLNALAAEQELEAYTQELEKINTKLEDANQLKDRFLSIASHELRTPITTIRGQAQLLLRRLRKQKKAALEMGEITTSLERINDQTGHLTALVDELLDVSIIRTGKSRLNKKTCNLGEICREVIEDQSVLTGRQITFEMPSPPILLEGDSDRLTQVFVNLVTNAVKYSPEDRSVEVLISQRDQAVMIQVRDYGHGIEKDQQERIFETFYRAPDAESSSKKGLGLGLAISRDIVERHDGRIWCESEPGQGSTFFVELPLQVQHAPV